MPVVSGAVSTSWRYAQLVVLVALAALTVAAAPLHERIDRLISARAAGPLAAPADDAEFLRRVYLDFTGTIPAAAEARAFLADRSPDKRTTLIDKLLASPAYARRMADAFDVILMERRTGSDANATAWKEYLQAAFAANKPWDRMAREILSPDADDEQTRAAAVFFVKRLEKNGQQPTDYPGLTRDIGRLFLGADLQCAQCHNHLSIKDYRQQDFQGLFAFVSHTYIRTDVKHAAVGEKALAKKVGYMSVFKQEPRETAPRIPFGQELAFPTFDKGQEWAKPPDKKTRFEGEPRFRTLPLLAEHATRDAQFKRNIANRLWFLLMGRGLVHPMDLHHSANPPSHPELLALLEAEFAAGGYDIQRFLRELALTQAYQRSSLPPTAERNIPHASYRVAIAKRLSAEQLAWSMLTATGELERVLAVKDEQPKNRTQADVDAEIMGVAAGAAPALSMKEVHKRFLAAFAGPAAEAEVDFAPSLAGALFISNDKLLRDWLTPRPGNLLDRTMKLTDPAAAAEELYLSILTRPPTAEEIADVRSYLANRDKAEALADLAWALLASTEFCVNH